MNKPSLLYDVAEKYKKVEMNPLNATLCTQKFTITAFPKRKGKVVASTLKSIPNKP